MKKINKNLVVFIFAMLFIGYGFSRNYVSEIFRSGLNMISNVQSMGMDAVKSFIDDVDTKSAELLRYHDWLMDANSVKCFVSNTRIVKKDSETVVRTASESLAVSQENAVSDETVDKAVSIIQGLYDKTCDNGAEFMYVAVPSKGYFVSWPKNIVDYTASNYDKFVQGLVEKNIPTLDFSIELVEKDKAYFITDHHWKPETGLWATDLICERLNENYGFNYNEEYTSIDNYDVTIFEDWFLGSYGKKVGTYFTSKGADDISLLTPKFETSLIEEQPFKEQQRSGAFEDTALYLDNIKWKDYYVFDCYSTYCGGNFRLQTIKNQLNTEGEKILLIKDSFGCVVAPFLSLNTSELHMIDLRDFVSDDSISVYEYIDEINPDYVIVLYAGFSDISGGKFDFDQQG